MEVTDKHPPADRMASLQSLLTTVVIAVYIITFIVQAFQIPSESMESTLLIGDYLLVDKLRYGGGELWDYAMPYRPVQRGDIVVFKYPVDPRQFFVKRVIAVPGDRVRLVDRKVYINGISREEPYVQFIAGGHDPYRDDFPQLAFPVPDVDAQWWLEMSKLVEDGQLIVPQGSYFVMGDNRDDSRDSRYWGFVPRENVVGRPLIIYWSVREASPDLETTPTAGAKLMHFAYALSHLFSITRWDRTFRLVR